MTAFPFVILGGLGYGVAKGSNFGILYYFPTYLRQDSVDMEEKYIVYLSTVGEVAKAFGGIWLGFTSDKLGSRVILIPICFALAALDFYLLSNIQGDEIW